MNLMYKALAPSQWKLKEYSDAVSDRANQRNIQHATIANILTRKTLFYDRGIHQKTAKSNHPYTGEYTSSSDIVIKGIVSALNNF